MSFSDELQSITLSQHKPSNTSSNNNINSQIDSVVLAKLNEIKNNCKTKALENSFAYNLDKEQKTIYGKIDFLHFSYPTDGLYNFMYDYNKNQTININPTGKKVYDRLTIACNNDDIFIKIGSKAPLGNKPEHFKDWYDNSLYETFNRYDRFDNPYQVYLGYKITLKMTQDDINSLQRDNNQGCYIATSVYGSYDCPEVWTLRRFRDFTLSKYKLGRLFIKLYYKFSPFIVKTLGNNRVFHKTSKWFLDKFIGKLHIKGYEELPYEDYPWK